MGRVFLAHDPRLDRPVAIKVLELAGSMPAAERGETLQRFLREARAAAKLHHPGIVTIYDAGEEQDKPYIAMEYIEGVGLDRFTRAPELLAVEQVVDVGIQACAALDYAHRSGLVHRDVKPANLMLVLGRTLKITDFGLAKHPEASLTSDGTLIGTPNYMSPEQIAGKKLDGRSDLFSLGVVLYELLAGQRPFQGDTISAVMYRILNEEPPPLHGLNPSVPRAVSDVVHQALCKNPDQRHSSGAEMSLALRSALPESVFVSPTGARDAVTSSRALPPAAAQADRRRNATFFGVLGSVAAAGVIASAVLLQSLLDGAGGSAGRTGFFSSQQGTQRAVPPAGAQRPVSSNGMGMMADRGAGKQVSAAGGGSGEPASRQLGGARRRTSGRDGGAGGAGGGAPVRAIHVTTDPPGSQLLLDGVLIDSDILRLELARGPRKVRAVKGCRSAETIVDPAVAPDELPLKLEPVRGIEVPVRSVPEGALITVKGGASGGKTPDLIRVDPCAGAVVTLSLDGHQPASISIPADLDPDAVRRLVSPVTLVRLPDGRVVFEPKGFPLEVREDGRKIGMAGDELTLPAGHRRVLLVNDDMFLRFPIEVTVEPGKSLRIDPPLPEMGKLSVQAYPSNCRVFASRKGELRNRFLDEVPMLDRPLAPGAYRLRVEYSPTGEIQEKSITIEPGRSTLVPFRFGA